MKKTVFNKSFFEEAFSPARMRPYFLHYPGNEEKAIRHYEHNIRLAESLLPSLSVFEITLKNVIIRELEQMVGDREWYSLFKTNPQLQGLEKYISLAGMHIMSRGEVVTPDKINGELTLGFWVALFNAEYEKVLWKGLRRAFPRLSKDKRQRRKVSAPLNAIRSLRNRVYHNEAITWSVSQLYSLHETIVMVIGWMNPSIPQWLPEVDRFEQVASFVSDDLRR